MKNSDLQWSQLFLDIRVRNAAVHHKLNVSNPVPKVYTIYGYVKVTRRQGSVDLYVVYYNQPCPQAALLQPAEHIIYTVCIKIKCQYSVAS